MWLQKEETLQALRALGLLALTLGTEGEVRCGLRVPALRWRSDVHFMPEPSRQRNRNLCCDPRWRVFQWASRIHFRSATTGYNWLQSATQLLSLTQSMTVR